MTEQKPKCMFPYQINFPGVPKLSKIADFKYIIYRSLRLHIFLIMHLMTSELARTNLKLLAGGPSAEKHTHDMQNSI